MDTNFGGTNTRIALATGSAALHPVFTGAGTEGLRENPALIVLLAPSRSGEMLVTLAAHLAWCGPLRVFDGGNRFNAYHLTRALGRVRRAAPEPALQRVALSRAFTCYQVAALLEAAPGGADPVLVADLLDTFYDESAALEERRRLLAICLGHLRRLSREAVVLVSLRPPRQPQVDAAGLLEAVQQAADQVLFQEELSPPAQQLALF